jgi:hypothetical protein
VKKASGFVLAAGLALMGTALCACTPTSRTPAAAAWTALAELPDWSGVWMPDWRREHDAIAAGATGTGPGGSPGQQGPKLTPEFAAKIAANPPALGAGGAGANCVPPGLPGIMTQPYPEDPDPTYMGHSIGHWEGDTLVIDSVGFSDDIRINRIYPHSDKMRIVERIRRVDHDWMQIETTTIDPEVLAEPYVTTNWYKHLDDEIREYICLENNHDSVDESGQPGFSTENQK